MVEHIAKPVDIDKLVETIQKQISAERRKPVSLYKLMVNDLNLNKPLPVVADDAIDWPALHIRFQGREASIRKLLETAIRTQNQTPDKIRHAIKSNDIDTLSFITHGLKSVTGFLEAHEANKLAEYIEEDIKNNHTFDTQICMNLANSMDNLLKTIADIIY